MSTGPVGYIYHSSSGKLVHPFGGSSNPNDNTELVLYDNKDDPSRLQMRFVPKRGEGHFGYIEHVSSGKVVHPLGGRLDPVENARLVLHRDRHDAALFGFNEADKTIIHKGGHKIWHPIDGLPNPSNNTPCVLHSSENDAAKFYFGDINGDPISPYPDRNLSGDWKLLKAFVDPLATHTYSVTYKTGHSEEETDTIRHAWKISAKAAYGMFKASAEYSGFAERSSSNTWSQEKDETYSITVQKGETVAVWQYVFAVEQLGEEKVFRSNIIGDSNDPESPPSFKTE